MDNDDEVPVLSGMGRGRGRGGVPVLPAGVWGALNNTSSGDLLTLENVAAAPKKPTIVVVDVSEEIPRGFGRGRGGGFGGRSTGGRGAPGRGRGMVRDAKGPDWDCSGCGNVNWCWRSTCNKCNTAKPASLVALDEVRDGRGGGFNERQVRVSAATTEVGEDGFDDFGRRIGKGMRDTRAKEAAALARLNQNYGFLLNSGTAAGDDDEEASHGELIDRDTEAAKKYDQDRGRDRSRDREGSRDRGRDRGRSKDRQRGKDRETDKTDRDKERKGDRDRDREKDDRYADVEDRSRRDKEKEKDRDRRDDPKGSRKRSRSRSRSTGRRKEADKGKGEERGYDRDKAKDRYADSDGRDKSRVVEKESDRSTRDKDRVRERDDRGGRDREPDRGTSRNDYRDKDNRR